MIIAISEDKKYKLVTIGSDGWYIYSPPIENPEFEMFIPADDPIAFQVAEMCGVDPQLLPKSYKAAEIILKKAIEQVKRQAQKKENSSLLVVV